MLRTSWIALAAAALLLAACGPEKYPHPVTYLSPAALSPAELPAPLSRQGKEYAAEVANIRALQASLSPTERARMQEEVRVAPEMVTAPVLGPRFNRERLPLTFALLDRVGSDNWRISDRAKNHFGTKRPFLEAPGVALLVQPPLYEPAYPSGHTTASGIWAETLALLLPQHAQALRARAGEIALNRVRAGMHYPHDVAGGEALYRREIVLLLQSEKFRADLESARAEIAAKGWRKRAEDRHIETYLRDLR